MLSVSVIPKKVPRINVLYKAATAAAELRLVHLRCSHAPHRPRALGRTRLWGPKRLLNIHDLQMNVQNTCIDE